MTDDRRRDAEPVSERQTIELREEILTVEKTREVYAKATVRRERRVREETIRLELVTEVLIITAQPGGPAVLLDGEPLAPGETREIVLYQETARPGKDVVVTQEVHLRKQREVEVTAMQVELAYEELVVNHVPTEGGHDDRTEDHQDQSR